MNKSKGLFTTIFIIFVFVLSILSFSGFFQMSSAIEQTNKDIKNLENKILDISEENKSLKKRTEDNKALKKEVEKLKSITSIVKEGEVQFEDNVDFSNYPKFEDNIDFSDGPQFEDFAIGSKDKPVIY